MSLGNVTCESISADFANKPESELEDHPLRYACRESDPSEVVKSDNDPCANQTLIMAQGLAFESHLP